MSAVTSRRDPPVRTDRTGLFNAPIRVRFSHCDPAGIVYFPRWFDLLNGVVEDWFTQALGLDYRGFHERRRIGLGYAHAEADFLKPGFWDDRLDVFVQVERVGGSSLDLALAGFREDEPVLVARLVVVTTDLDERRAIALPDDLRIAAERYRETQTQIRIGDTP